MGISRATYYRQPVRKERQLVRDLELRDVIEKIHLELPGYGYRRIKAHLSREGKRVNSKRIRRVMKEHSLFSCVKKLMKHRGAHASVRLFYLNLVKGLVINAAQTKYGQLT